MLVFLISEIFDVIHYSPSPPIDDFEENNKNKNKNKNKNE